MASSKLPSQQPLKGWVLFQPLVDKAMIPSRGSAHSAGYDLYVSPVFEPVKLLPGKRVLVGTGIAWQPSSEEVYMRIAPRSGLSLSGIDIGGGVVDPDYRGEIGIIVINNGDNEFEITPFQKIAQGIITPFMEYPIVDSNKALSQTQRGNKGFGSTGK